MRLLSFINGLGLGGTEKAACRWAWGLRGRGHEVTVLALQDGPRRAELEQNGVDVRIVAGTARAVADALQALAPDAIHAHAPGHPHAGDVLGAGLAQLQKKIPVVQTNIFGQLRNPQEDAWTDFRLFISWTSCVQAARRGCVPLDEQFFRRASVAVYPVDPVAAPAAAEIAAFRRRLGVADGEVLCGRLSRPDPAKWTNLVTDAFAIALRHHHPMKLLLREPPPGVADKLRASPFARQIIILPATAEPDELRLTMAALDFVLHTSSIGESFGYGIAEPMNLGRPVVTHSVPWQDQAQLELVRHGECGFVASTPTTMAAALVRLATDPSLREQLGLRARQHIRALADPGTSIARIEQVLRVAVAGGDSPFVAEDLRRARATAGYLDTHQFGHGLREKFALGPFYWRMRLHEWRQAMQLRKARAS